jgi:hypothetical protein
VTDAQIEVGAITAVGMALAKAIHWAASRIVASHDRSTHALIQSARSEATTQAMLASTQATLAALTIQVRGRAPARQATSARVASEVERARQRRTSPRGLPRLRDEGDDE